MGILRIVTDRDFRRARELAGLHIHKAAIAMGPWFRSQAINIRDDVRRWREEDLLGLAKRLDNYMAYNGGIIKLTKQEYRALRTLNRREAVRLGVVDPSPFLACVEGFGLRRLVRMMPSRSCPPAARPVAPAEYGH
ncbi:MAG: hypothetical protein QOF07_2187 [Bradyrhizobium sp.]|jgi:hypothetical protein|nr:hypothetical protein [Bradyrhizobium sp.]